MENRWDSTEPHREALLHQALSRYTGSLRGIVFGLGAHNDSVLTVELALKELPTVLADFLKYINFLNQDQPNIRRMR